MPHRPVLLKQIMLHCHTISYHCASIIADCSNTGQQKSNIYYLLSSLQRQHHHSTSLTTTDPSLHDGSSRLLRKSFRRSFCSAAGSDAAAEASAAGAVALRRRPARPARPARTRGLLIRRQQPAAPPAKGRGAKPKA
jgi:hypothetical protein